MASRRARKRERLLDRVAAKIAEAIALPLVPRRNKPRGWGQGTTKPSDFRLVRQAIREKWNVPHGTGAAVVNDVFDVIEAGFANGGRGQTRRALRASRLIFHLDEQNIREREAVLAIIRQRQSR